MIEPSRAYRKWIYEDINRCQILMVQKAHDYERVSERTGWPRKIAPASARFRTPAAERVDGLIIPASANL
jgi:hypothetical protein